METRRAAFEAELTVPSAECYRLLMSDDDLPPDPFRSSSPDWPSMMLGVGSGFRPAAKRKGAQIAHAAGCDRHDGDRTPQRPRRRQAAPPDPTRPTDHRSDDPGTG